MKDLRKQVKRKSKVKENKQELIQEKVKPSPESSDSKEKKDFNSLEEVKNIKNIKNIKEEKRSKKDISKIDSKYTLESNLDHKEYISKRSKIDISKFDHYKIFL